MRFPPFWFPLPQQRQFNSEKYMKEVKANLMSWQWWLSAAIAFAVLSLIVFPLVIFPLIAWLRGKFAKVTALLIASLVLSMTVQTTLAAPPDVDSGSPVAIAAHMDTVTTGFVTLAPMFGAIGNGEMLLALSLGAIFAAVIFFFTSKRLPRWCAGLTGGAFVFGVTLFYPLKAAAAQFVDQLIARQIVIYAQSTSDGTNGFLTRIGPSGTNWHREYTNGQIARRHGATTVTNFTGFVVYTNQAGGGFISNGYIAGALVCTNCPGATLPSATAVLN